MFFSVSDLFFVLKIKYDFKKHRYNVKEYLSITL